jgi:hypothetical protein
VLAARLYPLDTQMVVNSPARYTWAVAASFLLDGRDETLDHLKAPHIFHNIVLLEMRGFHIVYTSPDLPITSPPVLLCKNSKVKNVYVNFQLWKHS